MITTKIIKTIQATKESTKLSLLTLASPVTVHCGTCPVDFQQQFFPAHFGSSGPPMQYSCLVPSSRDAFYHAQKALKSLPVGPLPQTHWWSLRCSQTLYLVMEGAFPLHFLPTRSFWRPEVGAFGTSIPLFFTRQHLSYDDWRIRGKIIGTVLCYIVWHDCAQSYAHWYEQFLQMNCFTIKFSCVFLCFYGRQTPAILWLVTCA